MLTLYTVLLLDDICLCIMASHSLHNKWKTKTLMKCLTVVPKSSLDSV